MNVSIKEGQTSKQFSPTNYLRTNLYGSGTTDWVPEEDRKLTTQRFTENGTYIAQEFKDHQGNPYYGFEEVEVDVAMGDEVIGYDPDDGNEYDITVDPETGELVDTVLPSYIDITTEPTKTSYISGEAIDKTGMVVKAYKEDGSLWEAEGYSGGVIPNEEINIDPPVATGSGESSGESSNLPVKDKVAMPYHATSEAPYFEYRDTRSESGWTTLIPIYIERVVYPNLAYCVLHKHSTENAVVFAFVVVSFNDTQNEVVGYGSGGSERKADKQYTYNGKTVYFHAQNIHAPFRGDYGIRRMSSNCVEISPHTGSYIGDSELNQIAWTIRYGEHVGSSHVSVQWGRPNDGKLLTDTFDIDVSEGSSNPSSSSGNSDSGEHEGGGEGHSF
jgi:hypothetical protein